jgi:hypothetical protein
MINDATGPALYKAIQHIYSSIHLSITWISLARLDALRIIGSLNQRSSCASRAALPARQRSRSAAVRFFVQLGGKSSHRPSGCSGVRSQWCF